LSSGQPPPAPLEFDEPWAGWGSQGQPAYTGGNEVTLLRGGDALFPAMCAAIAAARREVWLASYIFHDDPAAQTVVAALVEAARRGLRVSVVVDGFGADDTWPVVQSRLLEGGVKLALFRPLHRWWNWLQPGQLRRLHHKLCVVDAEVAFVGGINLIDDRFDLNHGWSELPRLDFAVRVRGPLAPAVQRAARALWTRASLGQAWREEVIALAGSAQPLERAKQLLVQLRSSGPAPAPASTEAELRPVRAAFLVRDNLRQRRSIERSYVDAIRSARHSIDIVSAYFYPDHAIRHALRDARRRGVRVRLLLQGRWDYRMAELAAYALCDELLSFGVQIHEYTAAFLHAKVAVIDDDWATVGSSNIDPLSLLLNLEANVVVRDRAFAASLRQEVEIALASSVAVTEASVGSGPRQFLRRGFIAWCARIYLRIAGAAGRY
jgi:cardiolipin synthase